jgi:hypothetical protein
MAEGERVRPERRHRYAMWSWRALILLAIGPALITFGEVRVIAAGGGVPAAVLPDYTLLLPNLAVLSGSVLAPAGAAAVLVSACAALLDAVRERRGRASARSPVTGAEGRRC